ncbi:MAG: pyruvate kinase [Bacilli bacterium]|nr:pyruvate kinase [Bacilli bacterium]
MKKTKLICTIGPASRDEEILREMIKKGMNVARINLSHSTHEFAEEVVKKIRKLNKELNTNVGILFDTKGREIRVGDFKNGYIELGEGDVVTLTPDKADGENGKINISQKKLSLDLDIDTRILLDDGSIELVVIGIKNAEITCKVIIGGILNSGSTINIPDIDLNIDFLSLTDKDDILFASKLNVEYIALSFVRNANDILDVNDMLIGERNEHTEIISKIENQSAIDDIENIIKVSDGIMVARGDLGVEIPFSKLPAIQKNIIREARKKNKICIVSTEMLSSMETRMRPTRAEASDVANAVIDGVDAVMLSKETAVGKYPILSVETMCDIIEETESSLDYHRLLLEKYEEKNVDNTTVLAYTAVDASNMLKSKAIVVSTVSGYTARKVSTYRPNSLVIVTTPSKEVAQSLSLNWGLMPVIVDKVNSIDEIIEISRKVVTSVLDIEKGDKIVITGGFPIKRSRGTNFIKIEEI